MPAAATCAIQPAPSAAAALTGARATAAMPASCVTDIRGMAAKFRPSPATVTRKKWNAPIGNSASSAQIVATRRPAAGTINHRTAAALLRVAVVDPRHQPRDADQQTGRRAKGQLEARVDERTRVHRHQAARGQRQGVQGVRPVVDRARAQEHHGGEYGTGHRRLGRYHLAVYQKTGNRQQGREPAIRSDKAQKQKQGRRQHRDVAAGNGDHVVDAALLQPLGGITVEPGPIADEDRGDDGGGPVVVRSDRPEDALA